MKAIEVDELHRYYNGVKAVRGITFDVNYGEIFGFLGPNGARALLHQPKVLFLDEPTRGLDPGVAREIRSIIAELAAGGVTVFLTTHYMEEADRLSDRVAIIDQGEIVAIDTPQNLKTIHGENDRATLEDVFIKLTGKDLY